MVPKYGAERMPVVGADSGVGNPSALEAPSSVKSIADSGFDLFTATLGLGDEEAG